jgi:hypothetical protein
LALELYLAPSDDGNEEIAVPFLDLRIVSTLLESVDQTLAALDGLQVPYPVLAAYDQWGFRGRVLRERRQQRSR